MVKNVCVCVCGRKYLSNDSEIHNRGFYMRNVFLFYISNEI